MTRINLVPVHELADQHVFAEWRELPRMAAYALTAKPKRIPDTFTLGAGHMAFFLNKATWLENHLLIAPYKVLRRGYKVASREPFAMPRPAPFGDVDYQPTTDEIAISRTRIQEKILQKPDFYTWTRC